MTVVLEITVEAGEDAGRCVRVARDGAVIGRSTSVDVPIADNSASRQHAKLLRKGDDFALENLSPNGTTVNGKSADNRKLKDGDVIGIGATTRLRVRYLRQTGTVVSHISAEAGAGGHRSAFDDDAPDAPAAPTVKRKSLLARPKTLIGLGIYLAGLLGLWLALATRTPPNPAPKGLGRDEIRAMIDEYFASDSPAFRREADAKREQACLQRAREASNTAPVSGKSLWAAAYGFREAQAFNPQKSWRDPDDARRFREARERLTRQLSDLYVRGLADQRQGQLKKARDLFNAVRENVPDQACGVNRNVSQWIAALNRGIDGS